ncbi:MAG: hypothetical protein DMF38_14275 [Verrucomicrobia bacterium]|nr:MAG: hypothetical protein DMF38_14275 [Verrucomicrobiota bacterium]
MLRPVQRQGAADPANQAAITRGGGTGGDCSSAEREKSRSAYWNSAKGDINRTTGATQMMSIFG